MTGMRMPGAFCIALTLFGCNGAIQSAGPLPPFFAAIAGRNTDAVRSLLASGADPNLKFENSATALAYAVRIHENVPERQKRRLDGIEGPPEEDTEILELLLEYGADPNLESVVWGPSLGIAVYQGLTQSVRILLENGADPNFNPSENRSHLMTAVSHCYADIAILLIDNEVDIAYQDSSGRTARSEAEENKCPEVVDLIDRRSGLGN